VGGPPKGFSTALTGQGKAGVWVVMKDDASPNQGNVLAQPDADATGYRFPICVYDGLARTVSACPFFPSTQTAGTGLRSSSSHRNSSNPQRE
jgi:hypothetical protein